MKKILKVLSLILCLAFILAAFAPFSNAAETESAAYIFDNKASLKYFNNPNNTSVLFSNSEKTAAEMTAGDTAEHEETVLLYDFKSEADIEIIKPGSLGFIPGDLNRDGKIGIADSLLIRKYIAGYDVAVNEAAADTDNDGKVNSSDITLLTRCLSFVPGAELSPYTADVLYSTGNKAAQIVSKSKAPSVNVDLGAGVNADIYSYAVFTYMLVKDENVFANLTYSNGVVQTVELKADGIVHSTKLTCSSNSLWSGDVTSVKISVPVDAGESFFIDSLIFTETSHRAASEREKRECGENENALESIIFDSEEKTSAAVAMNSASVEYNNAEEAAAFTVSGKAGDPQVEISYSEADLFADDYKYIIVTYKVPLGVSQNADVSELFLCAGNVTGAVAGYSKTFSPVKDGAYHYEIISLNDADYWNGKINLIRFDFFSSCAAGDTMYVDSVCLAKTKAAAVETGKTRQALKNGTEPDNKVSEDTISVNKTEKEIKYYDALGTSSDGMYTFSGQMTAVFSGDADKFNRFTIGYSSNAIVRGVAYYIVGGTECADEFFLENTYGKIGSFSSIITEYFDEKQAEGLVMIELYTINTPNASVKLYSVDTEDYGLFEQKTYYIENSLYRLGVDFLMGGGVNYLEYFNDNNDAYGNLLNHCDVGRLIQQSYYGIDKPPYKMGYWTDREWGYNPVQGGDKENNISRIVDFEFRSDSEIYVKTRPMDWGQVKQATPSYMENVYTLSDDYIHVYNRFVDFSGYTHTVGWQELPAFYTISALNNFSYYNGSSPWTNDSLITRSDLVFWGQVSNQAFDLKKTSEFWSAWTDNSGFGVGLYVPGVYTYHAGKFMYDGSADPAAASTNYVAPRKYLTLICGKPLEYSYLVKAGTLSEIRNSFKENKNLINNYSLEHYN